MVEIRVEKETNFRCCKAVITAWLHIFYVVKGRHIEYVLHSSC
jgi:hypothetical protein